MIDTGDDSMIALAFATEPDTCAARPALDTPLLGTIEVARYEPLEELFRGGQGRIFLAHDTRLQRRVAIKELLTHASRTDNALATLQTIAEAETPSTPAMLMLLVHAHAHSGSDVDAVGHLATLLANPAALGVIQDVYNEGLTGCGDDQTLPCHSCMTDTLNAAFTAMGATPPAP